MKKQTPYFVISLDFELYWGMHDKTTHTEYEENIQGVYNAIPAILKLFKTHTLHATWATVGMLMCKDHTELLHYAPPASLQPQYKNPAFSAYTHITKHVSQLTTIPEYYFASNLITQIIETPHQELASHTFSHYYTLEDQVGGKNSSAVFVTDCKVMRTISEQFGVTPRSIVFPRNQITMYALAVCTQQGIQTYRGNETHFLYKPRKNSAQTFFIRILRLIDHYINISGQHTYTIEKTSSESPVNIPASRFLRPYNETLKALEPLRMQRIKNAMTHAAKNGEMFHLWWHPHNFGKNLEENMKNLQNIVEHFEKLKREYGMKSVTMLEASESKH